MNTVPVGMWRRRALDRFIADHRERLGAMVGGSDSHFGGHDIGRVVTEYEGEFRAAVVERRTRPRLGTRHPVPTGIAVGDRVWLWSDSGIVTCLEGATGIIRYQERVGGNFFGSPVWIEGRLFCVSTSGELVVVEASDKFNVLHRYALNELCHTTPGVALGRMFIRTEKHLWSFGTASKTSVP